MNTNSQPTSGRIAATFAVAAVVDLIQLPLTALSFTGVLTVPIEAFDFSLDVTVGVILALLLGGIHWVMIPAFMAEVVPLLDVCPTWTAFVGAFVLLRKQQEARVKAGATLNTSTAVELLLPSKREIDVIIPNPTSVLPERKQAS